MSPEHDGKLFDLSFDLFHSRNANVERFFAAWRSVPGSLWQSDGMLPTHLTDDERKVAMEEMRALPEQFYTRTQLPVITPSNVKAFLQLCEYLQVASGCGHDAQALPG